MRRPSTAAGLGLLVLLSIPPAGADVSVSFVQPEAYTDVGDYGRDAARNLRTLERHLRTQAARCVRDGESLDLRVLDVDLAGRNEWWHAGAYDLRVLRDITWPRLDVEFVWRDAQGKVLGEGRERLSDHAYLWRSGYLRADSDPLPYERAMLRDWIERRFCGRDQSRRAG